MYAFEPDVVIVLSSFVFRALPSTQMRIVSLQPSITLTLAACAFLRPVAAQDKPQIEYVFSGPATQAVCDQLTAPSFSISPAMDRYKTHDTLVIQCNPSSHTFKIDSSVPPTRGFRAYTFRWGRPGVPEHIVMGVQLPKYLEQCVALKDLFKEKIPQTLASSTGPILHSPHWSTGCDYDDYWGISMEIYLSGDDPTSH
jgi:hypothetical protein